MTVHWVCFVLLLVHSAICTYDPLYWYSTTSVDKFDKKTIGTVDFRGCFETECIYISPSPLFGNDNVLGLYENQNVWVISDSQNTSLSWVFGQEKPTETDTTKWSYPVPKVRIVPSNFDAKPYLPNQPDPEVQRLVDAISEARIRETVDYLASYHTRNSYSADCAAAGRWLQTQLENLQCQNVRLVIFSSSHAPNVICDLPGTDSNAGTVWIGAHYDSRARNVGSTTERAPGADDNGSGSAGVLEILRAIRAEGIQFRTPVSFAFWAGEEQGLLGSDYTATMLSREGADVIAYVNLDMIGYPQRNQPNTLWWDYASVDKELTDLGASLAKTYLGASTTIGFSTGCCSDDQSFYYAGFPAAGVFEASTASNNPNYHQSSDLPSTVNFNHVRRNTQMATALFATLAEA